MCHILTKTDEKNVQFNLYYYIYITFVFFYVPENKLHYLEIKC